MANTRKSLCFKALCECHTNWICSWNVTFTIPIKFHPAPRCCHTNISKCQSTVESFLDYASWCIVSHIFIAHYHYKLHHEGLRYSHTIPRHPVGLMQHLSPGWRVCMLLWCSAALDRTVQMMALLRDPRRYTHAVY